MKLIKPSFEVIDQQAGLDGIYRQIELAGRTCYKSENLITETSAKEFVDRMIVSGHGAMLEHGTVYLKTTLGLPFLSFNNKYFENKYSKYTINNNDCYITTNFRVLVENDWLDDLQYICEPTEYHEKRVTVKFICDRGVSHEFVRHKVFSFAQESTRYCNYSKDKFGNEITFIIPNWLNFEEGVYTELQNLATVTSYWFNHMLWSEKTYNYAINAGNWQPQQARSVLPNSLKTELVMTGFVSDWKHFFKLRCAQAAHPQAREVAVPLEEYFKQNNIFMSREEALKKAEILKAYGEGKCIQGRSFTGTVWIDIPKPNFESDTTEYRIKPEVKYIPFTFEDSKLFRDKWVYSKKDTYAHLCKIICVNKGYVEIGGCGHVFYNYEFFLNNFLFEDGTPCGKLVE